MSFQARTIATLALIAITGATLNDEQAEHDSVVPEQTWPQTKPHLVDDASVERVKDALRRWAVTGTCNSVPLKRSRCRAVASLQRRDQGSPTGFSAVSFQIQAGGTTVEPASIASTSGLFEIASNSKVLGALLLQRMSLEGLVKPTAKIGPFFPEIKNYECHATAKITLAQLASHTSGLPRLPSEGMYEDTARPDFNPFYGFTRQKLVHFLSTVPCCRADQNRLPWQKMFGKPCLTVSSPTSPTALLLSGQQYMYYSNVGFGLLGYVLSLANPEVPFDELIKKYVFDPLGMSHTTAANLEGAQWEQVIPGHDEKTGTLKQRKLPYGILQIQGCVHSNVDDLNLFLRKNLKELRSPGVSKLGRAMVSLLQPVTTVVHYSEGFGNNAVQDLGWETTPSNENPVVWKSGAAEGYGSFMGFDEHRQETVVAFENCGKCKVPGTVPAAIHNAGMEMLGGWKIEHTIKQGKLVGEVDMLCSDLAKFLGSYEARINNEVVWRALVQPVCTSKTNPYLTMFVKPQQRDGNGDSTGIPAAQTGGFSAPQTLNLHQVGQGIASENLLLGKFVAVRGDVVDGEVVFPRDATVSDTALTVSSMVWKNPVLGYDMVAIKL